MSPDTTTVVRRDILSDPWLGGAVFCLPVAVIALSGDLDFGDARRSVVWAVCLTVMGAGCLVNAARCERMHCYFTGPFLILMAIVSLSYGFGVLPIGHGGWNWIGGGTLGGGLLLRWLPERFLGRYRRRR